MFDLSKQSDRNKLSRMADDYLKGRVGRKKKKAKRSKAPTKMPKDEWTKDTRSKLLNKRNASEEHIRKLLAQCKALHHRERPIEVAGKKYFIDFLVSGVRVKADGSLTRIRVALEIDGGYHFAKEQQDKDRAKDAALLKSTRVWSILRIKDEVAMKLSADDLRHYLLYLKMGEVRRVYEARLVI